jgi:hypothetical protein
MSVTPLYKTNFSRHPNFHDRYGGFRDDGLARQYVCDALVSLASKTVLPLPDLEELVEHLCDPELGFNRHACVGLSNEVHHHLCLIFFFHLSTETFTTCM